MSNRYYLSPVDYEAWAKGYMPPSEHVLIDQLMFRGARPIMSSDMGEHGAWWLVIRGPYPSSKTRLAIARLLAEDEPDPPKPPADGSPAGDQDAAVEAAPGST